MNNLNIIGSADYAGLGGGWGQFTSQEVDDLNKALQTGEGIVAAGSGGASQIRLQSIENTLKWVEYTDKHVRLWKDIPKSPAYSTTEEYSKFLAYGSETGEGFLPEIGTPGVTDQQYERDVAYVKFIGVQKSTSIVSTLVKNQVGDMEAHQVKVGTTEMLGIAERNLMWADSRVNSYAWKGIIQQIEEACMTTVAAGVWNTFSPSYTIVDCAGSPLDPALLERHLVRVATAPNYGFISDLYAPYSVFGDFTTLYWSQHIMTNPGRPGGQAAGVPLNSYQSTVGTVTFKPMPLLAPNRGIKPRTVGTTDPILTTEPSAIVKANIAVTHPAVPASTLVAGATYYYWISKIYNGFESATVALDAVTLDPGDAITITVPDADIAGLGAYCGIRVYRSTTNNINTASWLADVQKNKQYDATGIIPAVLTTVYVDCNQNMENTSIAFAVDNDSEQVWKFRQLAPMMKVDLAVVSTAKPFMLLMFGVPIIYNARRVILFKNIGRSTVSLI